MVRPVLKLPETLSGMNFTQPISFKTSPSTLIFEMNTRNIKVSKTLKFEQEGRTVLLDVRGLIYYGVSILHLVLLELMVLHGIMMV